MIKMTSLNRYESSYLKLRFDFENISQIKL